MATLLATTKDGTSELPERIRRGLATAAAAVASAKDGAGDLTERARGRLVAATLLATHKGVHR